MDYYIRVEGDWDGKTIPPTLHSIFYYDKASRARKMLDNKALPISHYPCMTKAITCESNVLDLIKLGLFNCLEVKYDEKISFSSVTIGIKE